jgi:hypothetical protein
MLNSLDIALLCDKEWTDANGDRRTADRSRHGIHPVLGDGTTVGTFPTWDEPDGRYTFDGGDYLTIRSADDVDDVLLDMGGPQDETYLFYIEPWVFGGGNQTLFSKYSNPQWILFRYEVASSRFLFLIRETGGTDELYYLPAPDTALLYGRGLILAYTRSANLQRGYVDAVQVFEDTDATVDGSGVSNAYIGAQDGVSNFVPAGTGLRFFGYAQKAFTQVEFRAIQRFLRGML